MERGIKVNGIGSRCLLEECVKDKNYAMFHSPSYHCSKVMNCLSLNTIYLTSITQRAKKTFTRILKGADVDILWSYVVEETGEPGENHCPLDGRPLPCHMRTPGFDPGWQQWQASALTTALSGPTHE